MGIRRRLENEIAEIHHEIDVNFQLQWNHEQLLKDREKLGESIMETNRQWDELCWNREWEIPFWKWDAEATLIDDCRRAYAYQFKYWDKQAISIRMRRFGEERLPSKEVLWEIEESNNKFSEEMKKLYCADNMDPRLQDEWTSIFGLDDHDSFFQNLCPI